MKDCQHKQENMKNCNCSYPGCPRKGICCECILYHRKNNELPACFFPDDIEKSYDIQMDDNRYAGNGRNEYGYKEMNNLNADVLHVACCNINPT